MSIVLVLFGHISETKGLELNLPEMHFANLGVRVFFVISGYLITTLLMKEMRRSGTISLKSFYLRRVFRIFPPFYAYLLVIGGLVFAGLLSVPTRDLVLAATYTINFVPDKSWYVGHIWSLSVEEQFYMLWPAILFFLGAKRGLNAAAAVLVLSPLCRLTWFYVSPETQTLLTEAFPNVADAIGAGCVLAGLRDGLADRPRYLRFIRHPLFWLLPFALFALNEQPYYRLRWLVGETIINVGIAVIIDRAIRFPHDWVGRFLNHRSLVYVGTLSYSLYLWQQPFLNARVVSRWTRFPTNLGCCIIAALASFYLIERPALALRKRLSI